MDIKQLQAHWFRTLIYSEEHVCLEFLRRNSQLVLLPMSYECSCGKPKCLNIEDCTFMLDSKHVLDIYTAILAGSCSPDVQDEDGIEESPEKLLELDRELKNLDVIQFRHNCGWNFLPNIEGIFCLHLAICLNRKEVVKYIHSLSELYSASFFCFTAKNSFSYIHFAVQKGMKDMVKLLLLELKTLIHSESYFEKVTPLIIEQGNTEMCEIFVSSLKEGPNKRFIIGMELTDLLQLMSTYQKYDCLLPVISAMKQAAYGNSESRLCSTFYEDKHILSCLLQGNLISPQALLKMAVGKDDIPTVKWMMVECKIDTVSNSVLVQATLNNSPQILKYILQADVSVKMDSNPVFVFKLLELKQNSHNTTQVLDGNKGDDTEISAKLFDKQNYLDYSALDWATALGLTECREILLEHKQFSNPAIYEFCHPFSAVNYIESSKFDTATLMTRLMKNGFTVQQCMSLWMKSPTSRSPLYFAIIRRDVDIINLLLSNGADLEIWNDAFRCPFEPVILERFLFHNANICNSNGSVVNQILKFKSGDISTHLQFVLDLAHSVPRTDMEKIANFCADLELTWYDSYQSPSSLLSLCRKSLRRHCGYHIHDVVESISIPSRIRSFLLLTEELRLYANKYTKLKV